MGVTSESWILGIVRGVNNDQQIAISFVPIEDVYHIFVAQNVTKSI